MAITKVDSQGIIIKADSAVVGCLQSIGNIEESRTVKEYSCMTSNDSAKALGSILRGALDLNVLLDPATSTDGQKTLRDAFAANTDVPMIIELSDMGATHGTQFAFTGKVSKVSIGLPKDEAVTLDITVEIASAVTETAAD